MEKKNNHRRLVTYGKPNTRYTIQLDTIFSSPSSSASTPFRKSVGPPTPEAKIHKPKEPNFSAFAIPLSDDEGEAGGMVAGRSSTMKIKRMKKSKTKEGRPDPMPKKPMASTKITKASRRPEKPKEEVAHRVRTARGVTAEPCGLRDPIARRTTRSQTQPPEDPPLSTVIVEDWDPAPPVTKTNTARKSKLITQQAARPEKNKTFNLASSQRESYAEKRPLPLSDKNLKIQPKDNQINAVSAATKVEKPKRVITATSTKAPPKPLQKKRSASKAAAAKPVAPPMNRKRSIDSLGNRSQSHRKKKRSPSSGEDGENFSPDNSQSQSIFNLGSPFHGYSAPEHQESDVDGLQDATVLTIQRQIISNGRAGPRITYARERSYRADQDPGSLETFLNMPIPEIRPMPTGKRRLMQPNSSDKPQKTKNGDSVQSIQELRASGEHARFIHDAEFLCLNIEDPGTPSVQRSGCFEMVRMLRDKSFNYKFRINSYDERVLSKLDVQTDEIVCFILSYLIGCFLSEDSTPRTLLHIFNNGVFRMLERMLKNPTDLIVIAKGKKTNMSKATLVDFIEICGEIKKSAMFSGEEIKVMSSQIMALKILDTIVRRFREHHNMSDILPPSTIKCLLEVLRPISLSKHYPKLLKNNSFQLLELPVSTLEAYTMGGCANLYPRVSSDELKTLANLFWSICGWKCDVGTGPVLLLLLRLIINITNTRSDVCDELISPQLISSLVVMIQKKFDVLSGALEEQERLISIDLLVLGLGLMMNFAELSSLARNIIEDEVITFDTGERLAVDVLFDIFLERLNLASEADSMEESHTNVAFGYLAVLLGDLCQNKHIRYRALGRLPNCSLKCLVGAMEEFIAHHRKVDKHVMFGLNENESENEVEEKIGESEFTLRLQDVLARLRSYI